jgi:hypothetical protein
LIVTRAGGARKTGLCRGQAVSAQFGTPGSGGPDIKFCIVPKQFPNNAGRLRKTSLNSSVSQPQRQ